jgi:glutaredoxin
MSSTKRTCRHFLKISCNDEKSLILFITPFYLILLLKGGKSPSIRSRNETVIVTVREVSPFLYSICSNLHEKDCWWFFMVIEHVNGEKKGKVMLYALSTCGWCAKTKELLRELGVDFDYMFVDLLEGQEQDNAMNEVEKWNPNGSFPTLVIRDKKSIIGFREEEIREALK